MHFGLTFGACTIASVSYICACTTIRGNTVHLHYITVFLGSLRSPRWDPKVSWITKSFKFSGPSPKTLTRGLHRHQTPNCFKLAPSVTRGLRSYRSLRFTFLHILNTYYNRLPYPKTPVTARMYPLKYWTYLWAPLSFDAMTCDHGYDGLEW